MVTLTEYFLATIKPDDLITQLHLKKVDVVLDTRKTAWMPVYYKPANLRKIIEGNPKHPMRFYRDHRLGNPTTNRYKRVARTTQTGTTKYDREYYPEEQVRVGYVQHILTKAREAFDYWVKQFQECDQVVCLLCSCYGNEHCHTAWLRDTLLDAIASR